MAIYVDDLHYCDGGNWCHMMTDDNLEELHDMAVKIGLKRRYFQSKSYPHYDLVKSKRMAAIQRGAIPVSSREMFQKCVLDKKAISTP